jgi:autotransporter-associated beta strand protein
MATMGCVRKIRCFCLAFAVLSGALAARAASGTWTGAENSLWINSGNWSGTTHPSGTQTATFDGVGNGHTAIDLAGLASITTVAFTNGAAAYTLGAAAYTLGAGGPNGQTLLWGNNGVIRLGADVQYPQTFNVALSLGTGGSAGSYTLQSDAAGIPLAVAGDIFGATSAQSGVKTLNIRGAGDTLLSGRLTPGGGTAVKLIVDTTGTLTLAASNALGSADHEFYAGRIRLTHPAALTGTGRLLIRTPPPEGGIIEFAHDGQDETPFRAAIGSHNSIWNTVTFVSGTGTGSVGRNYVIGELGISGVAVNFTRSAQVTSGTPSITIQALDMNGAGIVHTLVPTTADLYVGDVTISANNQHKTLVMDGTSAGSRVDGVISNGIRTVSVVKANSGTWTLLNANVYTGTTAVTGGTLALAGAAGAITTTAGVTLSGGGTLLLDNTEAVNADRLNDAMPLTLAGGTLALAGGSETAGALIVCPAASGDGTTGRAVVTDDGTLTFAALVYEGGAVDFQGEGLGDPDGRNRILFTTPPVLSGGAIGPWATVNGAPATYDAVNGVTAYSPAPGSTEEIAARGPSVIPDDAEKHVRIVQDGTDGPIALADDDTAAASLTQANATYAAAVDTAGKTLRAGTVGIEAGAAPLTLGLAPGDGALAPSAAGGTLYLANASASPLTVNAAVTGDASVAALGNGTFAFNGPLTYTGTTVIDSGTLVLGVHDAPRTLAGAIHGAGSLVKNGTNTLTLLGTNTYTGATAIHAGIVRVENGAALGSADGGGVTVASGATLDIGAGAAQDGVAFGAKAFTVSGAGAEGAGGALVNNSAFRHIRAFSRVALAGDTTFGGTALWRIQDNTPALALNGHTLTKAGVNQVDLYDVDVTPGEGGGIAVAEGRLGLLYGTRLNGGASNTLSVAGGAFLDFNSLADPPAWTLALADGATVYAAGGATDGTRTNQNRWAGPVTLNGAVLLTGDNSTFNLDIQGEITGEGSIAKSGSPYISLSGTNNTYTGTTSVAGGRLYVSSLRNVGEPSSLGCPATAEAGRITLGSGTSPGALVYTGAGDTTDRAIAMGGTTGEANLYHYGTGPLTFTSDLEVLNTGTKNLRFFGTSGFPAEFAGSLTPPDGITVNVRKEESGTWNLSGTNRFSGTLTVVNGTLILSGSNTVNNVTAVNAGTLTVSGELHGGGSSVRLPDSGSGVSMIRLADGGVMTGSGVFGVGRVNGAAGAFHMEGGTFVRNTTTEDGERFAFGFVAGGYGYFGLSGGEAMSTRFQLGNTSGTGGGFGIARVSGGAFRCPGTIQTAGNIGTFHIGRFTDSVGVLTVAGGTLDHTGAATFIQMGYQGGRGEVNLLGGAFLNDGQTIKVRHSSGNSTGIVNVCAGELALNAFEIGSGGTAWLNLQGGTLRATANTAAFVPSAWTGVRSFGPRGAFAGGAVIDTDGFNVTVAKAIEAPAGDGVASIELETGGSGYIGEPYVSITGGGGEGASAVADMEDDGTGRGTYKVAGVTVTSPGWGYTEPPTVAFLRGGNGAVVPTLAAVTLAPNASGGLTKLGAGTLTLGAANTYTGATTVAGGTVKLANAKALPSETQVALAGGTLDLNGYTVTNAVGGSGTLANGIVRVVLSPGGEGAVATDTLVLASAALTGTYLADVTEGGESDRVAIQGDVDLAGLTLQLVNPALLDRRRTYTLLTCSGALSGRLTASNLPDRWHVSQRDDGTVRLVFVDGTLIQLQ